MLLSRANNDQKPDESPEEWARRHSVAINNIRFSQVDKSTLAVDFTVELPEEYADVVRIF